MKLRQLRYFTKVIETGNITRAAEQLNLAQTALGIQIRNLEESLGVSLLERHSRGVKPTRAGTMLYERANEILRSIDETYRDISSLSGESVQIRLGATPSIMRLIGTELIFAARTALPDINLYVVEELSFLLVDSLQRGELDFILAYDIDDDPGMTRKALIEEDLLYITAPSKQMDTSDITFKEAVSGDLALASTRDVIWKNVHETANKLSIDLNVAYEVQSMQGLRTLIQREIAQSIMPYGTVAEHIESGELVARRIVNPAVKRTLYLGGSSKRRPLPDEKAFDLFIDSMVDSLLSSIGPFASPLGRLGNS